MYNADELIKKLEPEIDTKCAEIAQRRSEVTLNRIFAAVAVLMLVVPTVLTFFGVSLLVIFAPIIFVSAVLIAASPIFISKGARDYERV